MSNCPLCGKPLKGWNYNGGKCINKKCKGYEFYYFCNIGYYFRVGDWKYYEKDDNPSYNNDKPIGKHFFKALKEFNLRTRYYVKKKRRRK